LTPAGPNPKKLLVIKRESSMFETELKLSTLSEHIGNLRQAIESMGISASPAAVSGAARS
jgi:hypothetical protein